MRIHIRSRSARRKAALRLLQELSSSERRPDSSAPDEASRDRQPPLYIELTGRPWLIGPGTLLVATYLERMRRDAERADHDEDPDAPQSR